jgi:DNA polymerase-3 subunit alpha
LFFETVATYVEPQLPDAVPWSRREILEFEKESLGLYVSGHPLESYAPILAGVINADCASVAERETGDQVSLGGIVTDLTSRLTKKGDRFALFRLEDQFGSVKVICWPEQFMKYKAELEADRAVVIKGRLEIADDGAASVVINDIQSLENARLSAASYVCIRGREEDFGPAELEALAALCERHGGETRFFVEVVTKDDLKVRLKPAQSQRINLSASFTAGIKAINERWEIDLVVSQNGGKNG